MIADDAPSRFARSMILKNGTDVEFNVIDGKNVLEFVLAPKNR